MPTIPFVAHYEQRRVEFWQKEAEKRRNASAARTSPRNPVASDLNDCEREMYLAIKHPEARPDPDPDAQERMSTGDVASKAVRQRFEAMGYTVVETEGPIDPHRRAGQVALTGRLDFIVVFEGQRIPVEVKDVSEWMFEQLATYDDLDRYAWTRKWRRQALAYCLQKGAEQGVVALHHRGNVHLIDFVLLDHMEDAEDALARAEHVALAAGKGEPPPFTKDPSLCRGCWAFGRICQPPIEEQGAAVLEEDSELHELLLIEAETAEAARRHEGARKRRNEILKAITAERFSLAKAGELFFTAICGTFGIAVTKRGRKAYSVAASEYQQAEVIRASAAEAGKEVA
jgi:hypothetical protein